MDEAAIRHLEGQVAQARRSALWVHLPDELRHRYRADRNRDERSQYVVAVLIGTTAFCLFTTSDAQLVPDVYDTALAWRLGLVVPLALFALVLHRWVLPRRPATVLPHLYASFVCTVMIGFVSVVQVTTAASTGVTYMLGGNIILIYYAIAFRPPFRIAAPTMIVMGATAVVALQNAAVVPGVIAEDSSVTQVVFVVLGLMFCHRDETTNRRLFVSRLRTELFEARRELRLTRLSRLNERLSRDARLDPLTGVPNRRALDDASREWNVDGTGQRAVLVIDLDRFKDYNDTYGHAAGDDCLRRASAAMVNSLREVDALLTRYGGEEFVALVDHVDGAQSAAVAERLRAAVEGLGIAAPSGGVVTVSVGVAWADSDDHAGMNDLVVRADSALYSAKASGRNLVVQAGPEPTPHRPLHDLPSPRASMQD